MKKGLLDISFDFSIRLMELIRYLREDGKAFPLSERLLLCGSGIGVSLRVAAVTSGKEQAEQQRQAFRFAVESSYLLELMVKTGYLTELQSRPLREDSDEMQRLICELLKVKKAVVND